MISLKSKIAAFLGAFIIGGLGVGATKVMAQTGSFPSFVHELAQKLGVEESKVVQAVDEIKKEHKSGIQDRFNQRLDQAVKDGKITDDQKQLILAKKQELQNLKQNFKNMTPEQRKQAMKNQRQSLEDWAKQNNIDLKLVLGSFGHLGSFKGKWGI